MKQMIPLEKMNKKQRKELMRKQRGSWGAINPVTRTTKDKKKYNRHKTRQEDQKSFNGGFCFV